MNTKKTNDNTTNGMILPVDELIKSENVREVYELKAENAQDEKEINSPAC